MLRGGEEGGYMKTGDGTWAGASTWWRSLVLRRPAATARRSPVAERQRGGHADLLGVSPSLRLAQRGVLADAPQVLLRARRRQRSRPSRVPAVAEVGRGGPDAPGEADTGLRVLAPPLLVPEAVGRRGRGGGGWRAVACGVEEGEGEAGGVLGAAHWSEEGANEGDALVFVELTVLRRVEGA